MNIDINHKSELRLSVSEQEDTFHIIIETRNFAENIGFDKTSSVLIATVASELTTNIIRYANNGEIIIRRVINDTTDGIEIVALDQGPGISNVELALSDSYTTTKDSLGLGLSSVKRIMDEVEIDTGPGKGTKVITRKWRK